MLDCTELLSWHTFLSLDALETYTDWNETNQKASKMRDRIYKHIDEMFIPHPHAKEVEEQFSEETGTYIQHTSTRKTIRTLDFGNAFLVVRTTDAGVHFRIEAEDILTYHGIWILLHGGSVHHIWNTQ